MASKAPQDVKGRRRSIYLTREENEALEREMKREHTSASYVLRRAFVDWLRSKGTT